MGKKTSNEMASTGGSNQYRGYLKVKIKNKKNKMHFLKIKIFQDLLDLLAKDLEFDYFIEEDSIHGFVDQDGNWTGLIGSLVDQVIN